MIADASDVSDEMTWARDGSRMMVLSRPAARSSCTPLAPFEFPASFLDDSDCSFAGLHASPQLCEAVQGCKRATHVANHRQVLAQDAVGGGVNSLVSAAGLLDEPRECLWLKSYQSGHDLPYGIHSCQGLHVRQGASSTSTIVCGLLLQARR